MKISVSYMYVRTSKFVYIGEQKSVTIVYPKGGFTHRLRSIVHIVLCLAIVHIVLCLAIDGKFMKLLEAPCLSRREYLFS